MTRVALTTWNGRISPVFDVAEHLLIVDLVDDVEHRRTVCDVHTPDPLARVHALVANDVDIVICGAIPRPVAQMLSAAGLSLIPAVCGDVECVLCAYRDRHLHDDSTLHLPGPGPATMTADLGGHRTCRCGKAM